MHPLPPQIEVAIGKTHVLGIFGFAVDRKRQRRRPGPYLELGNDELDFTGVELGVYRIGGTGGDPTGHSHHAFKAQRVRGWEQRRGHVDDALGDPVMVAQIDKEQLTVIAFAVHPTRKPGRPTGVGKAQRSAGVGPVDVHSDRGPASGSTGPEHGMERQRLSRRAPISQGSARSTIHVGSGRWLLDV